MSHPEERLAAALARGDAPSAEALTELLACARELRAESESRWAAIGRLAPAAKAHRGQVQDLERRLEDLAAHLQAPEASAAAAGDPALQAWLERARALCTRR